MHILGSNVHIPQDNFHFLSKDKYFPVSTLIRITEEMAASSILFHDQIPNK